MKAGSIQKDAGKARVIQRLAQETLALIIQVQVLATFEGLFDLGGLLFEKGATVRTATELAVISAHFNSKLISYPRLKGVGPAAHSARTTRTSATAMRPTPSIAALGRR